MTQKELKQQYAEILSSEVWHGNKGMIDFCLKKAAYIVELDNGDIVALEKPTIKTDFCFGYRDSRYDTEEYDNANAMADYAATSTDYFISENLNELDNLIWRLEQDDPFPFDYYLRTQYIGQPEDSKLKTVDAFYWHTDEAKTFPRLDGENRERIIAGYREVRAAFVKRLNAYLKRYGLSKINTWSYWLDA